MDQGRDARRPQWFWADNKLIDFHAARIGVHALAVYMVLVRHLNGDDECWPSTAVIAKRLDISRRTVVTAIQTLVAEQLIEVTSREEDGKGQVSNLYIVHRLGYPYAGDAHPPMQEMQGAYAGDAGVPMQEMHTNKTKKNKTQRTIKAAIDRARDEDPPIATASGSRIDPEIVRRLKALTYDDGQIRIIVAAAVPRGGFTLADVELGERWLDEQRPEWTGKFGKLYTIWKAGDVPVLARSPTSRNAPRTGPPPGEPPNMTVAETIALGAERTANALKGLIPNT